MLHSTHRVVSLGDRAPLADGARSRSYGRLFALALAIAFLIEQVMTWGFGVASSGGPDLYMRGKADLVAVLTGALMIRDGAGASLYDLEYQHRYQERVFAPYLVLEPHTTLPNSHPPFESLLLAPVIHLPYPVVFGLWTLLELAAFVGALACLMAALPAGRAVRWILFAFAFAYHPVQGALWMGQSSIVLLLGLCGAYAALTRRHEIWAGLALALLALKPQLLLPLVLFLLIRGYWKPIVAMVGTLAGLSVAAMPVLGVAWPLRYAQFLLGVRNWGANLGEHPARMYNWRSFAIHISEWFAPQMETPLFLGLATISVGLILWTAWYGRGEVRGAAADARADMMLDLSWATVAAIAVLLPTHLYLHDYSLLILPAWIIAVYATSERWDESRARLWLALLSSGFVFASLGFLAISDPTIAIILNVSLAALMIILLVRQMVAAKRAPKLNAALLATGG